MGRRGRGPARSRDDRGWVEIEKRNELFENYYKAQGIVTEDEWDTFYSSCKDALPVTFRITGSRKHAEKIRDTLVNDYIPALKDIVWDGEAVEPPTPLPWYPDSLAWQIRVGKTVIRKSKPFARFQRFLVVETDVGNISRQEAVSMIPPLLLDVRPDHTVIDLCAAPGSKTAQLIEAVHAIPEPSGIIVANDSDNKRSHMLIHQVKRLNSPNLVVTNHDAQLFPRVRTGEQSYMSYDRVLCDVPCSGDGTMRKNINVWRDWSPANGLSLHHTQLNILNRGLNILKPGGKLVYSTCSLNPVENEAVVAAALRQWAGKVKIVDASGMLPGLVRRKGVLTWKVMGKDKEWKDGPSEKVPATAFPQNDLKELGIESCMRVYPHDQDTGGFFITLLEKAEVDDGSVKKREHENGTPALEDSNKKQKSADSAVVEGAAAASEQVPPVDPPVPKKKERLPRDAIDEPFKFLDPEDDAIKSCWKFYSISSSFPKTSLLVRNATGQAVRTIYYVHPRLQPFISLNDTKIKFVHAGIKLFAYQKTLEGICPWRVQSEGMGVLYHHIGTASEGTDRVRVVSCGLSTLETLCHSTFPKFDELKDESFKEQVMALNEGCVFLKIVDSDEEMIFPLWRGRGSVNLMLPKQDVAELLHRVFKFENVKGSTDKDAPDAVDKTESETPAEAETQDPATEEPSADSAQA